MSEEEVERILRVAGIASAPLDPSSLEALRQLSRERQNTDAGVATVGATGSSLASDKAFGSTMSEFPTATSSFPNAANSSSGDDMVTSHTLAQMLQVQTKLLLETQQQLKKLTQKVDSLEEQLLYAGGAEGSATGSATFGAWQPGKMPPPAGATPAGVGAGKDPARNMPMNIDRNNMPMRPGQLQLEAWYETFCPAIIKRLVVLGQLFWSESKGVVRPLDGALLFKIVCMCLVAYGRTSSARKKMQQEKHADDPSWVLFVRINAKWFFLVFGLLYHTRYLHFLYQFVYVDNYPMRVLWHGEDMGFDHPHGEEEEDDDDHHPNGHHDQDPHGPQQNGHAPPHHRRRNPRLRRRRNGQPNNGQGDQPAWWRTWIQETFLMGVIQPRQPNVQEGGNDPPTERAPTDEMAPEQDVPPLAPQNQPEQQPPVAPNLLLVGIQDILYLFGSFFMSLFVVWHPRRPQDAPAAQPPPVEHAVPPPQAQAQQQQQHQQQQPQQDQEEMDDIDE